ncbi:MAG: hypothetical protein DLM62_10755 [Pseudonocardiales bacterium]|nr:MAG: hypothetical protein DLM62_10755 [Pseudonocardiales bacterium]
MNEPAVVSQVFCLRLSMVTESACWPKPPEGPVTPGTWFSVPASWPMTMLLNVASHRAQCVVCY